MPLPNAEPEVVESPKRKREDSDESDAERAREDRAEDPDEPEDAEVRVLDIPEVLMLGQYGVRASRRTTADTILWNYSALLE